MLPRLWNALTAAMAIVGVTTGVILAATAGGGEFGSATARAFNVFAYFTIQSNIIVGVTTLLLALRWPRGSQRRGNAGPAFGSTPFAVFRLDGLVMITITAVVYHTMLASLFDLHGWELANTHIVHTVVPALAIIGWLLWGPRGLISWSTVRWSVAYPVLWLVFTLTRGAIAHWYPYPFMDVDEHGYLRVLLTLLAITVAFLALAAGALGLDRLLSRRKAGGGVSREAGG